MRYALLVGLVACTVPSRDEAYRPTEWRVEGSAIAAHDGVVYFFGNGRLMATTDTGAIIVAPVEVTSDATIEPRIAADDTHVVVAWYGGLRAFDLAGTPLGDVHAFSELGALATTRFAYGDSTALSIVTLDGTASPTSTTTIDAMPDGVVGSIAMTPRAIAWQRSYDNCFGPYRPSVTKTVADPDGPLVPINDIANRDVLAPALATFENDTYIAWVAGDLMLAHYPELEGVAAPISGTPMLALSSRDRGVLAAVSTDTTLTRFEGTTFGESRTLRGGIAGLVATGDDRYVVTRVAGDQVFAHLVDFASEPIDEPPSPFVSPRRARPCTH